MAICDLCGEQHTDTSVVSISPDRLQQAVRDGFNPYQTPGINLQDLVVRASAMGLNREEVFPLWVQRVMTDTTDWGICPACDSAFREATRQNQLHQQPPPPTAPPQPPPPTGAPSPPRPTKVNRGKLLAWGTIGTLSAMGLIFWGAIIGEEISQLRLRNTYGSEISESCIDPNSSSSRSYSSSSESRYIILEKGTNRSHRLHDSLPEQKRSMSKDDLTGIICLEELNRTAVVCRISAF